MIAVVAEQLAQQKEDMEYSMLIQFRTSIKYQ